MTVQEPVDMKEGDFFKKVIGLCKGLTSDRNKRQSLDPTPIDADHVLTKDIIGKSFPFQGRRKESAIIYGFICGQDEVRMNAQILIERDPVNKAKNWDNFKRFDIPVSMGIAGIGKSELARIGVSEHIKALDQNYLADASPSEQQFLAILKDERKCCNIRLGEMVDG